MWYHYHANSGTIVEPFYRRGNYVVIGQYVLVAFCFNKLYGNFKIGYARTFESVVSHFVCVVCMNFVTYLQLCLIGRWAFLENIQSIVYMTLIDWVVVMVWVFVARYAYVKLYPPRDLLLIYGKYSPDGLMNKLLSRKDRYNVKETISIDCSMEEIKNKISQFEGVMFADIPSGIRNPLLKYCFANSIRCYSIPKISDILIMHSEVIHQFDTSLLLFRNSGLTSLQMFWKRVFDIVFAVIAIIVTSPIMLIIAILVKAYDGGPVFFLQERLTKDGKVFKIIKFRSMCVNRNDGTVEMTKKNDERVTPVGKVLRNLHLDELPQFINILKGDMSVVGPRPECPQIAEKYCEFLPEFEFRLKVKAGLTGYAQVYGKYNTTPYDKLKLDLKYIRKYSFLLDMKLMLLTLKIFFWREKSEGIENWQTTAATRENLEQVDKE